MFVRFAKSQVLDVRSAPSRVRAASLNKMADFNEYRTDDGYVYVRVRAISSRVNKNHDGWPSKELEKSYRTFIGKPIFVDHHNSDPKKARGVVVDAQLHIEDAKTASLDPYYASEGVDPTHLPPTWIELLLEVDAKKFPKLAKAIVAGEIDGVSMGANVESSVCSHCGNEAHVPEDFCKHVLSKGAYFDFYQSNGTKISKRSYENCHGVGFFEISFVFDPADETALASEIITTRRAKVAAIHAEAGLDLEDPGMEEMDVPDPPVDYMETGQAPQAGEAQSVIDNRYWRLVNELGYPEGPQTMELAKAEFRGTDEQGWDTGVDLHQLKGLLDQGATHEQAAGILAKTASTKTADEDRNSQVPQIPQSMMTSAPEKVDTLRKEQICPICFAPGTLVRTRKGYVPIDTIEVGDEVLTESGRFESVLDVIETPFEGFLHRITARSLIEPILVTAEHPIKTLLANHPKKSKLDRCRPGVCDKSLGFEDAHSLGWACAEHLTSDSYLVAATLCEETDLLTISVPERLRGHKAGTRATPGREYVRADAQFEYELTPDFLWMVGLYIAEGSSANRELTFSLNQDEVSYIERLQTLFATYGFGTRTYTKPTSKGIWFMVHSTTLAEWFAAWIGEGCAHKTIPSELMNLPSEKLQYVLSGIFDGDGTKSNGVIGQTSPRLALQLVEIGLRLGEEPTLNIEHPLAKKTVYKTRSAVMVVEHSKQKSNTWKFHDKTLYRVQSNELTPYFGSVYNLHVANDNTYVVQNMLVHNCGSNMEDGECEVCNYVEPPEGFDNPDLEKAKQVDDQVHDQQAEQALQTPPEQPIPQTPLPQAGGSPAGPPAGSPALSSFFHLPLLHETWGGQGSNG